MIVHYDQPKEPSSSGRPPNATYFGTIGGVFVSGAAQAARFSDCNTGRLAPCRYKVSGSPDERTQRISQHTRSPKVPGLHRASWEGTKLVSSQAVAAIGN